MIPQNYEQWKHCIENDCGIKLTPTFVQGRLKVFEDASNAETIKFQLLYGKKHLQNVVNWLIQAK